MSDVVKDVSGFEVEDRTEYGVFCDMASGRDGFMYDTQELAETRAQGCAKAGHDPVEIHRRAVTIRIGPWEKVKTLTDDAPDAASTPDEERHVKRKGSGS